MQKKTREAKRQNVIVFFLFVSVISMIYCIKFTSEALFVSADGLGYFFSKVFWSDSVKAGELPLWNPYVSIGMPFLADSQMTALSPFNILYLFLDVALAYNLTHIIQLIIAGYFMYLLMFSLTEKYLCSINIGFLFAFCTVLGGARIEHPTIIATVAFFPVVLYCFEKFKRDTSSRYLMLAAVVMAIQFVIGFTQILLYFDIVLFFYLIYILRGKHYNIKNIVITCAKWISLYILLISVQLVPMATLVLKSGRGEVSWETFSVLAYDLRILLFMLFPTIYNNQNAPFGDYASSGIDIEIYIGIICLIYIIYELIYCWKDCRVKMYGAIMLGTFVFGMSPNIPILGKIIYNIPLLNSFRVCARSLPIFILFSIIMTGMGMSHIYEKKNLCRFIKINGAFVVGTLIVLVVLTCIFSQPMFTTHSTADYYQNLVQGVGIAFGLCVLHLIMLYILARKPQYIKEIIYCLIGVLIVLDVSRFSVYTDERRADTNSLLDSGLSAEIQAYIDSDTKGGYRTFALMDNPLTYLTSNELNIAKHSRSIYSQSNVYNSYATFLDNKLNYWGIKETAHYPGTISNLKENPALISMLGIRHMLDTEDHYIDTKIIDDTQDKKIMLASENIQLVQAEEISYCALHADWIMEDTSYLITVNLGETTTPDIFYADFYNPSYDNVEQDGYFINKGNGVYQTIISTENIPKEDIYVRIIVSADKDFTDISLMIEEVPVEDYYRLVPTEDDEMTVYINESAQSMINIPEEVVTIEQYAENWKIDGLVDVDRKSYVIGLDEQYELGSSNAEVKELVQKRNSVSAIIYSTEDTFVNHAQLAYPGWNAYVDGKKVKVYEVNNLIQGAIVPAGEHVIEFRYEPMDVVVGTVMTMLGIAGCFAWHIADRRREKQRCQS